MGGWTVKLGKNSCNCKRTTPILFQGHALTIAFNLCKQDKGGTVYNESHDTAFFMDNCCVKYYSDLMLHVWPKHGHGEQRCEILDMIEQTDRRTDRRTNREIPILHKTLFWWGGGINSSDTSRFPYSLSMHTVHACVPTYRGSMETDQGRWTRNFLVYWRAIRKWHWNC